MLTLEAVRNRLVAYGCCDPCFIWKVAQMSVEQVRIPLQLSPGLVECELCDLWNGVSAFE
jgi:hypothetical protein